MEQKVTFSIEESIQRLKAEIIAQDWRLSPNRVSQLKAAFACLRQRFKTRKATHAMLVMAESTLDHIKKMGGNPPETIDFLKEAMAHVVNLYEELAYDPEKEEQIFQKLFNRFSRLKAKIKQQKPGRVTTPPPKVDSSQETSTNKTAPSTHTKQTTTGPATIASTDVEALITDLKNTLEKAGEVGSAIGRVLEELIEKHSVQKPAADIQETTDVPPQTESAAISEEGEAPKAPAQPVPRVQPCPPTELTELVVNGKTIALQTNAISLTRSVKVAKLSTYLKQSNVPLKDFSSLFQALAKQFSGSLAQIHDSKLKQLKLPIMNPQASDWPETPDEEASKLVVVSNGNWHGVIACSSLKGLKDSMIKFEKQQNGDIAGIGHLESGQQVKLLDLQRILRREGFLVMV